MVRLFVIDAVRPALSRARTLLFQPESLWRTVVIFLIANLLVPSIGLPDSWTKKSSPNADALDPVFHGLVALLSPGLKYSGLVVLVLAAIGAVIAFLLMAWRVPFMFFDLATRRRFGLREIWEMNGPLGMQWFGFNFCLGIAFALVGALMHLVFPGRASAPGILLSIAPWAAGILAVCFVSVEIFTEDFVVPVLALESSTVPEAIKSAWSRLIVSPLQLTSYLAAKAILATVFTLLGLGYWFVFDLLALGPLGRLGSYVVLQSSTHGTAAHVCAIAAWILSSLIVALLFAVPWLWIRGAAGAFCGCLGIEFYARFYPALREELDNPPATQSVIA